MEQMFKAAQEIFKNRDGFILVGLTGRSGSGCSTVANILTSSFEDINLPQNCHQGSFADRDRKKNIIYNFAKANWKSFFKIKVSDIITTFVLECSYEEFSNYIKEMFGKEISGIREEYLAYYEMNKCLNPVLSEDYRRANKDYIFKYIKEDLKVFAKKLKGCLGDRDEGQYTSIYQEIGNNIRKYGVATPQKEINVENIYALAHRINKLIKVLRKYNAAMMKNSYFVIDAFRNPFEALFFQERYSAFYLFAIRCTDEDRIERLTNIYNFSRAKIVKIDERENPKESVLKNMNSFLSQDIATCIQLADIHIANHGQHTNKNFNDLKEQIVRYISLIQHPGLINPSRNEKVMQIAYTAKLNSGCLSRKVGAVVTNSSGIPKAIGWNSSPEGQTSCLLRSAFALLSHCDDFAYSDYENTDVFILGTANNFVTKLDVSFFEHGLNCSFCFKDFQNLKEKKSNQVHNRALHAEENAFLQVAKFGGEGIHGGKLYTTASPCDSCSRKAYQLGIKEIYYIDPYPGIATSHVLSAGSSRPHLILFCGAIGQAYHKLYDSIIPYKDELYSYLPADFFKK